MLATTVNLASMVQRFEFSVDPENDPGFDLPFFYDTTITFPKGAHVLATPRPRRLGADLAAEAAEEAPAAAGAR